MMSHGVIRLTLEVSDPHTADLLRWLDGQYEDNPVHKLRVLKLAQAWLMLDRPHTFTGDPERYKTPLQLVADSQAPASS